MKMRVGFVSNSSSSSFVLDKGKLSGFQIEAIRNHIAYVQEHYPEEFYASDCDAWNIREVEEQIIQARIELSTFMDNFDMDEFLRRIDAEGAILERGH